MRKLDPKGGAQKCEFIKDELGFDAAIDHRSNEFDELLAKACPMGVDVGIRK